MPVKSLNTTYKGCHFRSRLEARWAVFLDAKKIRWEYEPQGFEVGNRLRLADAPEHFNYLPDFWLPDHNLWFEVKGSLNTRELARLLTAAACLSANGEGAGCGSGHDLIVAGPLTQSEMQGRVPVRLHMHKGDLYAQCMFCHPHSPAALAVANDTGDILTSGKALLSGFYCHKHAVDPAIDLALITARASRFEFGRRG